MLGQKIDAKTSLWLFTCLVTGLFLSPMIVGAASRDMSSRLTVGLIVTLAAAILGAVVKHPHFALCCSALLTWPAFGYALLMLLLRGLASSDQISQTAVPAGGVLAFAAVAMLLAPFVTAVTQKVAGPKPAVAAGANVQA